MKNMQEDFASNYAHF